MRTGAALAVGVFFVLVGSGWAQNLLYPPTPADRQQVLAEGWEASRDRLEQLLLQSYEPGGPQRPGRTGNTAYRKWLMLWKWSELLARNEKAEAGRLLRDHLRVSDQEEWKFFPPGYLPPSDWQAPDVAEVVALLEEKEPREKFLGTLVPEEFIDPPDTGIFHRLDPKILHEWVEDGELSEMFFSNLSEWDYAPAVLTRLQEIRLAEPEQFQNYLSLAVAIALVYDQVPPAFWPHPQVNPELALRSNQSAAEIFSYWVKSNKSRDLYFDLRTLKPEQIKFIVDAPVPESELEWSRKNVRSSRRDFGEVFSSITYDSARLQEKRFIWLDEPYSLANIRRAGGICVDQAYYAMVAGKARGLPTLFFTGQGQEGGHAWFGYMKSDNRWDLDCGRDENQNYAIGEALDPQSWLPISDHELEFLAQSFRDRREFTASEDDLLLAQRFEKSGQEEAALKAYASAVNVCPENIRAWEAKADSLERSGASTNERRAHYEAAIRRFARDRDFRTQQQSKLASVLREAGYAEKADALESQIVSWNKRLRSDLSVDMVAQKISSLLAQKNYDEAYAEYRRQLLALRKTGGGNFFYDIVRPFALEMAALGDARRAREIVEVAQKVMRPEPGSILDGDFQKLAEILRNPANETPTG